MPKRTWKMFKRTGGCIWKNDPYFIDGSFYDTGMPCFEPRHEAEILSDPCESFELAVDVCDVHRRLQALEKITIADVEDAHRQLASAEQEEMARRILERPDPDESAQVG